jgi:hypothetical protein
MIITCIVASLLIMSLLIPHFQAFETVAFKQNFVAGILPDLRHAFMLLKVPSSERFWLNFQVCDIFSNIPFLQKEPCVSVF